MVLRQQPFLGKTEVFTRLASGMEGTDSLEGEHYAEKTPFRLARRRVREGQTGAMGVGTHLWGLQARTAILLQDRNIHFRGLD